MKGSPPPAKRIKLESPEPPDLNGGFLQEKEEEEDVDNQCSICLQRQTDRALIPHCSHEFCFECLVIWTDQSRRCPLCTQGIGKYLIHNIRSRYDYTKYFLPPLRSDPPAPLVANSSLPSQRRPTRRERRWGQGERREQEVQDQLERSIEKRKWVYRHHLYAKHVASNIHTRYRPFPTPAQFAASPDYLSRATSFLRRELQVWPNLDVEFLTTFTLSIMKSLDIRSESTVKLLSEFLDMDQPYVEGEPHPYAEHFAHEMHSYLRSPFRDLYVYDKMVQYEEPEDVPIRTRRNDMEIKSRSLPPSGHNNSPPGRADGDKTSGTSRERRRKRNLSRSRDRARARDPSVSPPPPRVTKGKERAVDLSGVADGLSPAANGSGGERTAIDKGAVNTRVPNVENTVIGDSKRGNRDRAPKALTLRQSVQAHLSLQKSEPLKVSRLLDELGNNISGPSLRHGRPSLLERISGMEEILHRQSTSVSPPHVNSSTNIDPIHPLPSAPQLSAGTNGNACSAEGGTIDNQSHNPVSNVDHENDLTAPADRPDRTPRVDTEAVLQRTRIRLAKMKNTMVAGIPPTAPTPPPIPLDLPTPVEPEETTPPTPVVENLRNRLWERLESERKRAIGAASGELSGGPVAGNISEDSLQAELRARSRLRARLAVTKGDSHVDILEP